MKLKNQNNSSVWFEFIGIIVSFVIVVSLSSWLVVSLIGTWANWSNAIWKKLNEESKIVVNNIPRSGCSDEVVKLGHDGPVWVAFDTDEKTITI